MGDVAVDGAGGGGAMRAWRECGRFWWLPSVVISLVVLLVGDMGFYFFMSPKVIYVIGGLWVDVIHSMVPMVAGAVPPVIKLQGRRRWMYLGGMALFFAMAVCYFYRVEPNDRSAFLVCIVLFLLVSAQRLQAWAALRVVAVSCAGALLFAWTFNEFSAFLRATPSGGRLVSVTSESNLESYLAEQQSRYLLVLLLWLWVGAVDSILPVWRSRTFRFAGMFGAGMILAAAVGLYFSKGALAEYSLRHGFPLAPTSAYFILKRENISDERVWQLVESAMSSKEESIPDWVDLAFEDLVSKPGQDHGRLLQLLRVPTGEKLFRTAAPLLAEQERREFLPQVLYEALVRKNWQCAELAVQGRAAQAAWVVFDRAVNRRRVQGDLLWGVDSSEIQEMLRCMRIDAGALPPGRPTGFSSAALKVQYWEGVLKERARGVSPGYSEAVCAEADQVVEMYGMLSKDCRRLEQFRATNVAAGATRGGISGLRETTTDYDFVNLESKDLVRVYGVAPPVLESYNLRILAREISAFHARVDARCAVGR